MRASWLGFIVALSVAVAGCSAAADDRHAGYYYPEPQSQEVYTARAISLAQADRAFRLGFVTGFTNQMLKRPFPPTFAIFLKGSEAEKMIIVALEDGRIDTIYRARAIFANMTAIARLLPAFVEMGVQDEFTFFDLAKMIGVRQITISDGRDFAHQVTIE
jgi:hypothetical protein